MQTPAVLEAGDVLQVLEVCEAPEEIKEVIVTTLEEGSNTNSTPVTSCGAGTKPSQVRLTGLSATQQRRRSVVFSKLCLLFMLSVALFPNAIICMSPDTRPVRWNVYFTV